MRNSSRGIRSWLLAGATALAVATVVTAPFLTEATAQPPERTRERRTTDAPKADPAMEAWVKTLADKIADRHDAIRDSAREGLVAVGAPALPALRKIAEGDDNAAADAARKVIARIENGPRAGQGGRGGIAGAPGAGLGGPGGRGGNPGAPGANPGAQGAGPRPGNESPARRPEGDDAGPRGRGEGRAGPGREGPGRGGPEGPGGPDGPPPGGPGARPFPPPFMSQALKDLKLSEAQQGKVKDILDANQKKVRELMQKVQEGKVEREEIMDLHKKLMDNLLKEMKAALDEEQFKKFEAAIKENGPGPRGGPPGGGRPGADRNEGDQPPVRRPV